MHFKNKSSPILFVDSWRLLIENINYLQIGDIIILNSKEVFLKKAFIITKQVSTQAIKLILAVNNCLDIKELILTPDSF
jgi:hypothetical protein